MLIPLQVKSSPKLRIRIRSGYLGPVVAGAALAVDEVVRAEGAAVGAGADRVHRAGLQVDEDRPAKCHLVLESINILH